MTCMFRLSQLCTPPSTQTPESFKRRSASAASRRARAGSCRPRRHLLESPVARSKPDRPLGSTSRLLPHPLAMSLILGIDPDSPLQGDWPRLKMELGATRSNVLERSAAQHGAGKALRHQRRGCAVLRRSAAGALGTSDRASRAAVQVPLGRLALASFGNPFFFDLLCGRSCESTPKPSRQWRRAGRVSGPQV